MSSSSDDIAMSLVEEETVAPLMQKRGSKRSKKLRLAVHDPEGERQESSRGHRIGGHKELTVCSKDFIRELRNFQKRNNIDDARELGRRAKDIVQKINANPKKAGIVAARAAQFLNRQGLPSDSGDVDKWEQACKPLTQMHRAIDPVSRRKLLMKSSDPKLRQIGNEQQAKVEEAQKLAKAMTKSWKDKHPGHRFVFQTDVDAKGQPICGKSDQIDYSVGNFKLFYNKGVRSIPVWRKHSNGEYVPFCTLPTKLRKQGLYEYFDTVSKSEQVPPEVRSQFRELVQNLSEPEVAATLMRGASIEKNYLGPNMYAMLLAAKQKRNPTIKSKTDPSNGLEYFETLPPATDFKVPGTKVSVPLRRPVRWYNLGADFGGGHNLVRSIKKAVAVQKGTKRKAD